MDGGRGVRITADRERCVGSGMCVLNEDRVFDQSDKDGRVLLLREEFGAEVPEDVRYAVTWCPSQALEIHED
jgi:ferredoxin